MAKAKHFVFDTNSLVSAALIITSVNAQALNRALETGRLAISATTFNELAEVLYRPKFDKYLTNERRVGIMDRLEQDAKVFTVEEYLTDCRDPKDNKFLELAVASKATCIITGDKDLLTLHPFRGIPIITATEFLSQY